MSQITHRKLERRMYDVKRNYLGEPKLDEHGKVQQGKFMGYKPALPKMIENAVCPCHKRKMQFLVSDGQAINLRRECKRQTLAGKK